MAIRRTPLLPPPYATDRETLEREVVVEVFRASGPGGQHVNKTESALRLVHPPSGVVVIAQDSSSQHRNREIAFERLAERLERLNYVPKKRVHDVLVYLLPQCPLLARLDHCYVFKEIHGK